MEKIWIRKAIAAIWTPASHYLLERAVWIKQCCCKAFCKLYYSGLQGSKRKVFTPLLRDPRLHCWRTGLQDLAAVLKPCIYPHILWVKRILSCLLRTWSLFHKVPFSGVHSSFLHLQFCTPVFKSGTVRQCTARVYALSLCLWLCVLLGDSPEAIGNGLSWTEKTVWKKLGLPSLLLLLIPTLQQLPGTLAFAVTHTANVTALKAVALTPGLMESYICNSHQLKRTHVTRVHLGITINVQIQQYKNMKYVTSLV